jgi:hypothetical protein
MLDDGMTVEVTRCCTLGDERSKNAASMLYATARRAAAAIGYAKIITYTLDSEEGTSLRAAGWEEDGLAGGGSWSRPSRARENKTEAPTTKKRRHSVALA